MFKPGNTECYKKLVTFLESLVLPIEEGIINYINTLKY